jgi:hypothetical protein
MGYIKTPPKNWRGLKLTLKNKKSTFKKKLTNPFGTLKVLIIWSDLITFD